VEAALAESASLAGAVRALSARVDGRDARGRGRGARR